MRALWCVALVVLVLSASAGCLRREPVRHVLISATLPHERVSAPGFVHPNELSRGAETPCDHFAVASFGPEGYGEDWWTNAALVFHSAPFGETRFECVGDDLDEGIRYAITLAQPECEARVLEGARVRTVKSSFDGVLLPGGPRVAVFATSPCRASFTMAPGPSL